MPYSRTITPRIALIAAAIVLAACASKPMPTEQLAVANSEVERAERAGAAEYAAADLATAREKLQRARNGADSRKMDPVEVSRLAQQAEADARLADAETQAGKARAALATTQADLQALEEEAQRAANAPIVP